MTYAEMFEAACEAYVIEESARKLRDQGDVRSGLRRLGDARRADLELRVELELLDVEQLDNLLLALDSFVRTVAAERVSRG